MKKQTLEQRIKHHAYFNKKFFARWARVYDYEKYILFPIRKRAAGFIDLPIGSTIIDVASGTGAQSYMLAKRGYDVVGLDLSPEMLQQARKKLSPSLKLRFILADATQIPFDTNTFDGASISLGLHDMPYEIRLQVLKEMKRVVKPNGPIMIIDYLEPQHTTFAHALHLIVRNLETPMYKDFLRRGLFSHLKTSQLTSYKETVMWKCIQIKVCKNKKPS